MKRAIIRFQISVAAALLAPFVPCCAKGDGGIILLHGVQGTFSVTVFTSSETPRSEPTDVSLLIQRRETGEVLLDVDVTLTLNPPNGLGTKQSEPLCAVPESPTGVEFHPLTVRATREQASNKLLYAAPVQLNVAGDWQLHVRVSRGPDTASFDCLLPVTLASGKLTGIWPYLALPPLAIAVFAMNQCLRRRSLEKRL